jgi:CRISPR/Cas system-associated exonuclease Cas4 (RecB family)
MTILLDEPVTQPHLDTSATNRLRTTMVAMQLSYSNASAQYGAFLFVGCPELLARLDLITETEDDVVITDLKTSRSRWSQHQVEDSAEQLLLYSELVRDLVPGKPLKLQFVVVTKGKQPVVDNHFVSVDPNRIARIKKVAQRVWQAVQAGNFYPSPSAMNCPSCGYRRACKSWAG